MDTVDNWARYCVTDAGFELALHENVTDVTPTMVQVEETDPGALARVAVEIEEDHELELPEIMASTRP